MTIAEPARLADVIRDGAYAMPGAEIRERYGASALKRAVARGDLVRLLPDVYAPRNHAHAFHVRALAATVWAHGVVSGIGALFMWGLVDVPPDVIEVTVPHGSKRVPQPGFRVRQSTVELPQTVRQGVPVVSAAAAVVLGYGQLPKSQRSDVFYAAVRKRLVSAQQLEAVLARVPRAKARRSLERSIRAAAAGAQSYLEERALYRVFNTAEFAHFRRQHEVVVEGNQFFLDMFDAVTSTSLELDGRKGHLDKFRQRDISRDCWLATVGILTLRFSYRDLVERPDWCRQIVREVLRVRAAQVGHRPRT